MQNLKTKLNTPNTQTVQKMALLIDFIRPKGTSETVASVERIKMVREFLAMDETKSITDEISLFFMDLKISLNLSSFGILSRNGFGYELRDRFYNKFLPSPPNNGELKYVFATLFPKSSDAKWVEKIDDEIWAEFFASLFASSNHLHDVKNHLFHELLYVMELLAVRIASEEFDENFIRLDPSLLSRDSAFIALSREINELTSKLQNDQIDIEAIKLDFKHLSVLLSQCKKQVEKLKKRSVNLGISIGVSYELEYISQVIKRLEDIAYVVENFDTKQAALAFVKLFKSSVQKNTTRNSLSEVLKQNSRIIAKSITNNIGEHGEKYVSDGKKEYLKILFSSAGAGIVIAMMALIKIHTIEANFSILPQTIINSLNYGLGFVFIHILGFTVATKQPAMTASTFASEVEKDEDNVANQNKLIELIFKVARSQFASVLGNVSVALTVAFLVSRFMIGKNEPFLSESEAVYYLSAVEPKALFFAAIAGVWLFCSGLIAGYFDNRADCLELEKRFYHHPWLKKLIKNDAWRKKFAIYMHEHHGALNGNFFFGVLLGFTPFIGHIFELPLDIAHVAFSSANLGYASTHLGLGFFEFIYYLVCVLMIGAVNLIVSFVLALKVSLISRDTHIGNFFMFLKALFLEAKKRPLELMFPIKKG